MNNYNIMSFIAQGYAFLYDRLDIMNIDFSKLNGLVPVVIQNDQDKTVLMVGFMNEEAYKRTKESDYVHFWSRSRRSLWMKGETSGNKLKVVSLAIDCDNDTLLANVNIEGDGVCCHTGSRVASLGKSNFSDL